MVPDLKLPLPPTGPPEPALAVALRLGLRGLPSDYSVALLLALIGTGVDLAGIVTSLGANPMIAGENALSQVAEHMAVPLLRLARVNDYDSLVALREASSRPHPGGQL